VITRRAAIDLAAGDGGETGHGRTGLERRLLLGHRDGGADVLGRGLDRERFEGGEDVDGPGFAAADFRRDSLGNLGARNVGIDRRRAQRWIRACRHRGDAGKHERAGEAAVIGCAKFLRLSGGGHPA
jgi:hypothetical protein